MRTLKLDYRQQDKQAIWRRRLGLMGLLAAGLGFGYQIWHYRDLGHELAINQAEAAQLGGQSRAGRHDNAMVAGAAQNDPLDTEMRQAREVLLRLGRSWSDLFDAVEASTRGEVALLEIEPEPERELVRITGEAKTYPAVLAYVRRLEESATLKEVILQSHQLQENDPERPLRFVLAATWRVRS